MINISDIWDNIDIVSVSSSNTLIQRKKVTSYWLVSTLCQVWLYKYIVITHNSFSPTWIIMTLIINGEKKSDLVGINNTIQGALDLDNF